MTLSLSLDLKGLDEKVLLIPRELFRTLRRDAFPEMMREFHADFTRSRLSGGAGLSRRTGELAKKFIWKVSGGSLRDLEGRVGWVDPETAKIARAHELGTQSKGGELPDIRSTRPGGKLFVPLPAALTAAGVLKAKYRPVNTPEGRRIPGAELIPRPGKPALIVETRTRAGREKKFFTPIAVLLTKVALPPRLEFLKSANSKDEEQRRKRILGKAMDRAANEALGRGS